MGLRVMRYHIVGRESCSVLVQYYRERGRGKEVKGKGGGINLQIGGWGVDWNDRLLGTLRCDFLYLFVCLFDAKLIGWLVGWFIGSLVHWLATVVGFLSRTVLVVRKKEEREKNRNRYLNMREKGNTQKEIPLR